MKPFLIKHHHCNRELSSQSTVSFVSLVWKSGFLLWQIEKSKRGKRQREKAPSSCLDRWTRRLHSLKSDNWPTCVESHGCSVLCFFVEMVWRGPHLWSRAGKVLENSTLCCLVPSVADLHLVTCYIWCKSWMPELDLHNWTIGRTSIPCVDS